MNKRFNAIDVTLDVLLAFVIGLYCEHVRECTNAIVSGSEYNLFTGAMGIRTALYILAFSAIAFAVIQGLRRVNPKVYEFCFKWRYAIAAGAFIILTALQISGSSISVWGLHLSGKGYDDLDGLLFGLPRTIRSDEWLVATPQAFSQAWSGYSSISEILRGQPTDVTIVYGQPAWAIATLFRPFTWGYLIFGSQVGLSFFWNARLITLLMVSFEFARMLTHDKRQLAFAYALLMTFSPFVQWWFATTGTADLFIYAQGMILVFGRWIASQPNIERIGLASLFAYLAGCFIMIVYPAWQICIAYVIGASLIAQCITFRKGLSKATTHHATVGATVAKWATLAIALTVVALILGVALYLSFDVVKALSQSSYPGQRFETGGTHRSELFSYAASWLGPCYDDNRFTYNFCEMACFFSLFPLGSILALISLRRKPDPMLICMLVIQIFMCAYGIIGFPAWLARITLLSSVPAFRLPVVIGFVELCMLFRASALLADIKVSDNKRVSFSPSVVIVAIFSIAFSLIAISICYQLALPQLSIHKTSWVMSFLLVACASFAFIHYVTSSKHSGTIIVVACVIAIAGLCVNPIQQGANELTENDLVQEISHITQDNKGQLWIADNNILSQAAISAGAPTISSVATYPALDIWEKVDSEATYYDVYNRYAYVIVTPTDEETTFSVGDFSAEQNDAFTVRLNVDDLEKLGVDYWISNKDLTEYATEKTTFTKLTNRLGANIFRVDKQ